MRFISIEIDCKLGGTKYTWKDKTLLMNATPRSWGKSHMALVSKSKQNNIPGYEWMGPFVVEQVGKEFTLDDGTDRYLLIMHPYNKRVGKWLVAVWIKEWTPNLNWVLDDQDQQRIRLWLLIAKRLQIENWLALFIAKQIPNTCPD